MKLYTVDKNYMEYLKTIDNRVSDCSGMKEKRPFIGIVLNINNINYFAPLSSPKDKFLTMKNMEDFIRINNGQYGAINLNNMIPVDTKLLTKINLKIEQDDDLELKKYKSLLIKQINWINKNQSIIKNKALKLYLKIINDEARESLKKRCIDFKIIEKAHITYFEKNK